MIFGLRHEMDENTALLGYCAASSGSLLPIFRYNFSVPYSSHRDGRDRLFWNVGKEVPLLAA